MGLAALDTNVLLRLIITEPAEQHERAHRVLTSPGARFLVVNHVFVELVFALERHYKLNREQVTHVVNRILELGNIECDTAVLSDALEFWRTHAKLSFEDCLAAEMAQDAGAVPLWTFDRKLAHQHPAALEIPS